MIRSKLPLLACFLPLFAACGGDGQPSQPPASAAMQARLLGSDPGEASSVLAAKQDGPRDHVIVTGRIAAIVKGLAAFTLMDKHLPYCGETKNEDTCATPWDYCCETAETRTENSLAVELRDANGKPLATPSLGALRLLDEVEVVGSITKDEHGNFALNAEGVYRVSRPQLPNTLRWPQ